MKSPLLKLVLACLLVLGLSACSPASYIVPASPAVQLPLELKVLFNGIVLAGVVFAANWLFEKAKLDLRGIATVFAGIVAEFALLQFQGWIDLVPAAYDVYVTLGLNILLTVLTTLGYIRVALLGIPTRIR